MTLDEKISLTGGNLIFYTNAVPRLDIPAVFMADATQGIHIRKEFDTIKYNPTLQKSTAFPSPILLASTWNPVLAYDYANAVGEECRAGGIPVLLGPGMNIYRLSQCGRNFEYFGEDPYLASRMIENYVVGLQKTGTIATLKHFVANNTDYFRRKSNSIVDERTLNEIYMPAFKAGIDAGAMAVMTSYNQLNGEWCGQSYHVITGILREQLGFKWLVMTDWWSVNDGAGVIKSGQDIEMPAREALEYTQELIDSGVVNEADIDRMVTSLLRTLYAMNSFKVKPDPTLLTRFAHHEEVALNTAREGIVLLRNENNILPLEVTSKKILLTGDYINKVAAGGGAAEVEGYNHVVLANALKNILAANLMIAETAADEEIKVADAVILNIGTYDSEGYDRPFELPDSTEKLILRVAALNPNTVVVVNSGSGIDLSNWYDKVSAIIYAWYPGQNGATAVAEILTGILNPSGKLPMTIERKFKDSPGYGYLPEGEELYVGWNSEAEEAREVYDVIYDEGVFVGYRWYEKKNIKPLFAFGFGLSYTSFSYSDLKVSNEQFTSGDIIEVSFVIKNTGERTGAEIAQLYIHDTEASVERPVKELKGFKKVKLNPGESKTVTLQLGKEDFSFWSPEAKDWIAEPGKFEIRVGSSSDNILLNKEVELI
ncbi:MAG: glycoside hydrolase family 3 C-terminal domain-containing protein [Bacteroidales bacterium]|nr:glycoside hydrolase family 3 C-terminal domain-containing protein [Bacteroidales bacterium]